MPFMKKDLEKKKNEIIRLIDYNQDNWVKAAFFSDEVVEVVMESLYNKWAESGEMGRPIDYASEEELDLLYKRAKKYASMSTGEAMNLALGRMGVQSKEEEKQ